MESLNFNKDVLERSYNKPVVVDFWAPWCGPCRVLGPTIEQLAREQSDRWELVKVNTEEEYELAERYRIRSIPNVKMFYRGEEVAEFMGALPRSAVQKWLDQHLPDDRRGELERLLSQTGNGHDAAVLDKLVAFATANPDMPEAAVQAARRLIFTRPEQAEQLVEDITLGDKFYDTAEDIRAIARFLAFAGSGDESNPAATALAEARDAVGRRDLETAVQKLITATAIDKNYEDDLPRKTAIAFFRTLGDQHPLTKEYRRRFDMALY